VPALPRIIVLTAALAGSLACAAIDGSMTPETPASLPVVAAALRPPQVGLPMHAAPIVAVELLPPGTGEQWRMVSGDAEGWIRIWADGELLAAWHAHRGGLADLRLARDGSWYSAGVDGRIHYWGPGATEPGATLVFGRPVTAIAVADEVLAISDGAMIELWSREAVPRQVWRMKAGAFVTGLEISPGGDIIAAAELRQSALLAGAATHPQATFVDGEALGVDADEQAALRARAKATHPGAAADIVEVWEPLLDRHRALVPRAPIDRDLGIRWADATIVYREIYGPETAIVVGRRTADLSHVTLELVKPWAFWQGSDGNPTEASETDTPSVGDFRIGAGDQVVVLDHFPGWSSDPPARGWRAGDRRELAFDANYAALGDGLGNLAVVAWARPAETGWTAPGEVTVDLVAAAADAPVLATATLEPRTDYRLWDLDAGSYRSVRVESAWRVTLEPELDSGSAEAELGPAMFPNRLALDGAGAQIVSGLSSYFAPMQVAVRVIDTRTGAAEALIVGEADASYEIGISRDGAHILAWLVGNAARSWARSEDEWTPGRPAFAGVPRFSANGRWSVHVSGLERHIVDLDARAAVVSLTNSEPPADLGAETLAAVADDGTAILVQPYGGGTLERIDAAGERSYVELPGAATALCWVEPSGDPAGEDGEDGGGPIALIGFLDGSIARLDPGADAVEPIEAGAGGRIWALEALAAHPGTYVEHDDRGLTLHRLDDRASLELHLADDSALARAAESSPQPARSEGLVAIWQGGTAQPPCRVLDGASVELELDARVERWPVERAPELFASFFAGEVCTPPEPVETAPDQPSEPAAPGSSDAAKPAEPALDEAAQPDGAAQPDEAAQPESDAKRSTAMLRR